jgi:hypothetical protein
MNEGAFLIGYLARKVIILGGELPSRLHLWGLTCLAATPRSKVI